MRERRKLCFESKKWFDEVSFITKSDWGKILSFLAVSCGDSTWLETKKLTDLSLINCLVSADNFAGLYALLVVTSLVSKVDN